MTTKATSCSTIGSPTVPRSVGRAWRTLALSQGAAWHSRAHWVACRTGDPLPNDARRWPHGTRNLGGPKASGPSGCDRPAVALAISAVGA